MKDLLSRKGFSRFTTLLLLVFTLSVIGVIYTVSVHVADNCSNTHKLYQAIDRIIIEQDDRVIASKTLTLAQKKDYLKFNRHSRELLASGDCE